MSASAARGLPEPMIELLLKERRLEQPNAIIESVEASTGIAPFATQAAFEAAVEDMRAVAKRAGQNLKVEFPELFNGNSNGNGNGHHADGENHES